MKKAGFLGLSLALGFAFSSSCAAKREVTIDLLEGCTGIKDAAAFVEFVVYPNACPPDDKLRAGDVSGARYRATVPADQGLPSVGDLPKSKFGFAVILRDDKCTVTGFGCTEADLESIKGIRIKACDWAGVNAEDPSLAECTCQPLKGGGCVPPTQCSSGQCLQVSDQDASGCSLLVEKAGPLPDPVAATARLTGPAIAATDDGFVMAYRDQDGATLRAVVMFVNDEGVPGQPAVFDLGGCASKEPKDGVGVAYEGGSGLMATSLPDCGSGAGAVFVPFDSLGQVGAASGPRNATFLDLSVAPQGVMAPAATVGEYELLYRVQTNNPPVIERVVLQGPTFKAIPIVHPFGEDDLPFGMVATSPKIRAFLAPFPAGLDGGSPGTKVRVGDRLSDTIDVSTLGEFDLPLASWATMTAWNNHVAAAVPASTGLTLTVADWVNNSVNVSATGLVGTGPTLGGALAALRNHFFVAQGYSGGIRLYRLTGAETKLTVNPVDSVELPAALGAVNLTAFGGTQLAMAAARNKVALVWLNKPQLSSGDLSGGWALLRCSDN